MENNPLSSRTRPRAARLPSRQSRLTAWSIGLVVVAALLTGLIPPSSAITLTLAPARPGGDAGWSVETVEESTQFELLRDHSIAVDSMGRPHIVYGANYLYHAWFDGSEWRRETVDRTPGAGYFASLAIDAEDYEHISYANVHSGELKYAHRDAAGWRLQTVDQATQIGLFPSLALDSAGRPHLAYCAATTFMDCSRLKYASWNGASWDIQVVTDQAGPQGVDSSYTVALALDPANRPHIIYFQSAGSEGPSRIRYATWDGAAWQFEAIDGQGNVTQIASLALDPSGQPRVSYYDGNTRTLRYAVRCETGWETQAVDAVAYADSAIAVDAAGRAQIAYWAVGVGVKLARWNGSDWDIQVVEPNTASQPFARYTGLALDAEGHPHISYAVRDKGVYYAGWTGTAWERRTVDNYSYAAWGNSLAVEQGGKVHVLYQQAPEGLKYASRDGTGWTRETVTYLFSSSGMALALDPAGNPGAAYYDLDKNLLKYAYRTGGSWQVETIPLISGGLWFMAPELDIAISPGGRPGVVYQTAYGPYLVYAERTEQGWVSEFIDDGVRGSLAFDTAGDPAIAYVWGSDLKYARRIEGRWRIETIMTAGGSGPSLALDDAGRPLVAYIGQGLQLAQWTGQEWQTSVVDDNAGWYGPHLALGAGGSPMITYSVPREDGSGSDIWFAERTGQGWATQRAPTEGNYGVDTDLATDGTGAPYILFAAQMTGELKLATRAGLPEAGGARFSTFLPALLR